MSMDTDAAGRERALLVQVTTGRSRRDEAGASLGELARLADTAGASVIGSITQQRDRPTPGLLIGKGKLLDIELACREGGADLVIFDNDLSAVQAHNLARALEVAVIDRTELILRIFARRAQTAEAQAQVELAQLEYLVKRLPDPRRQQRFQGGIGMRGPGESPLEQRNEPMRRRIRDLKRRLAAMDAQRRRRHQRRPWPLVCLVGYTNAGKTTLLNALTQAGAYVDDRLFATLDTRTRLLRLPGNYKVLLADTVGFIRRLPHGLVASFRSTLDHAREADQLLIVAEAGHPHMAHHLDVVRDTLAEIGAAHVPARLVLNKADTLDAAGREALHAAHPGALTVSARQGSGLAELRGRILEDLLARGGGG